MGIDLYVFKYSEFDFEVYDRFYKSFTGYLYSSR